MKKFFALFAIITFMASCGNVKQTEEISDEIELVEVEVIVVEDGVESSGVSGSEEVAEPSEEPSVK